MKNRPPATALIDFQNGLGVSLCSLKKLAERRRNGRRIRVFLHRELGNVFVIGDEVQHVEAWAPLYHEPLVHLPASFVPKLRKVLILGGGTLFAASEALKYDSVEEVTLIDHDSLVTELAAAFYPHARSCLRDPRFRAVTSDAYSAVETMQSRFDLIINDGIDLLNVSSQSTNKVSAQRIINRMRALVAPSGVCADVVYRHVFERRRIVRTLDMLRGAPTAFALVFLPEYHGILHLLTMWGNHESNLSQDRHMPLNREQRQWLKAGRSQCAYYDPRFLRYYLHLPHFLRVLLKERVA